MVLVVEFCQPPHSQRSFSMIKKTFIALMTVSCLAACSSWQGSPSSSESHKFISYNSSKDDYSPSTPLRLPSSKEEKKSYWCDSPRETNFVSYGNDKDYYPSDSAQALLCH